LVRLEGASLTEKQVRMEVLICARDRQTFTLLTDPQSIMAIGLRFMISKVTERKPVADRKTGWDIATILEDLNECYPLAMSENFVRSYKMW